MRLAPLVLTAFSLALCVAGFAPIARAHAETRHAQPHHARPSAAREREARYALPPRAPGVSPRRWSLVVVHHSGTSGGSARAFEAYHRGVRHMARGMAALRAAR